MAKTKTPADEAEELREATRAAHEAMQGLRDVLREMREVEQRLRTTADEVFEERMAKAVEDGLTRYGASIDGAIETATDAVFKRFDTLTEMMLGETKANKRRGDASLTEYAQKIGEARGADVPPVLRP